MNPAEVFHPLPSSRQPFEHLLMIPSFPSAQAVTEVVGAQAEMTLLDVPHALRVEVPKPIDVAFRHARGTDTGAMPTEKVDAYVGACDALLDDARGLIVYNLISEDWGNGQWLHAIGEISLRVMEHASSRNLPVAIARVGIVLPESRRPIPRHMQDRIERLEAVNPAVHMPTSMSRQGGREPRPSRYDY